MPGTHPIGLLLLVLLGARACLINPQKDFPVGLQRLPEGGATSGGAPGDAGAAPAQGGQPQHTAGTYAGDSSAAGGAEPDFGGGGGGGAPSVSETPTSCAAWQASGVTTDGLRVVDPDGSGPIKPFSVFCSGMAGEDPQDFLELPHTDATGYPGMNTSTYSKPGNDACPCPDSLSTSFSRVRLRVSDLTVLCEDRTFTTFLSDPTCHIAEGACEGEHMGYGEGADCRGAGITTGSAEIDLRDTPFHIAPNAQFAPFGYAASGNVDISPDRKRATITGGGFCGGYGPADPKGPQSGWPTGNELTLERD